jgi:hypothetical protein
VIAAQVNWTTVLVALISALPAIIAALYAGKVNRAIRTPSGDPIGHVVERAHEAGIANHLLLQTLTPDTKPANGDEIKVAEHEPLQVPSNAPDAPPGKA